MSAILELIGASLGYPDRVVLEEINLVVEEGQVFAIVGPNGVGKSTMIKAASGILPLMGGEIRVDGQGILSMSPERRARRVGVVPQATQTPRVFTAEQIVLMGRTPYLGWLERESAADHEMAKQAMERTETTELADRIMGELSGGEQQRVMVARALAQSPRVMLLDEPTAHLDLRHQDEILKLIKELAQEEGMGVLIALHDLNLVARFADRVALLSNRKIKEQGPAREVLTPDNLAGAYGVEIHVMEHPIHGTPLVLSG